MRRHLRKPGVWIAALILLAVWLLWPRPVSSPPLTNLPSPAQTSADGAPLAVPPSAPASEHRSSRYRFNRRRPRLCRATRIPAG